jgi:hypothetical protein
MNHGIVVAELCSLLIFLGTGSAAEKTFDLTTAKPNEPPPGFRSALAGTGQPGDWRVLLDDVPLTLTPLTPGAAQTRKIPVIAQLSADRTDERFPLLICDDEVFGDFKLSVRFKTVGGAVEQMAGVAFRLQDERNYYVVRASALGRTFRFYRVYNGVRDNPIGPEMAIPSGVWHELAIECEGNRVRIRLDGQVPIPEITDPTYAEGKIALWTKSDSVSYFSDLRIEYTPRESLAKLLVRDALAKYPRLLGLRIVSTTSKRADLHIVASSDLAAVGQPGNKFEKQCIEENTILCGKADQKVIVTMPLHDRNGDPIAAVRFEMESFPGQTEQNAVARAQPIRKRMQPRVTSLKELTE